MIQIITYINPIVGIVNIMTSQVLSFLGDAHGLRSTTKERARLFLEIWLIKAASSLCRENEKN
jgi:hypothetical protein